MEFVCLEIRDFIAPQFPLGSELWHIIMMLIMM